MGEKLEYFEKSSAQKENNPELDLESFYSLSQRPEGLSNVPEKVLKDFVYELNDVEDVLYTFKFISDDEMYSKISNEEKSSFVNLDETGQKEIKELAGLFSAFLSDEPILYENTSIDIGEEGPFIAYVNEKCQRLDVSWKNKTKGNHIFEKLLTEANAKANDYPKKLRSFGNLNIFLDEDKVINVKFSGDASKKDLDSLPSYAPGYLRNFEEEFKEFFGKSFKTDNIKIQF